MKTKSKNILDKLYDYQLDAVTATDKNDKGIVCMPTGTGKTFVQASVITKEIQKNKGKFGIYVINAPRIMLSYQLLKEVYSFLMYAGIDARYMSVHSGGSNDMQDLENIRIDANFNEGTNIQYAEIENGTSPILIREFVEKAKREDLPVIFFSTYNSAERINDAIPTEKISIVMNDESQYLVQEQFYDIIHTLNTKRCYFFTATTIHTPSDKGRGMNNVSSYGEVIYLMTPREAIDKGKMVRPRMHFVITPDVVKYDKDDVQESIGKIISEAYAQHNYKIGNSSEAKMLVSVKGVGDIERFFNSKEYKLLLRSGHRIYAVASDEKIGNNINGEKVNRREFLDRLKSDGRNTMLKLIILHYDILAEGIDVPGITGIMPLRTLGKAKFLQTYGRAARLDIDDRKSIESGEIKPNELDKLMKPYAWVIIPTILNEDDDDKKHIEGLLNELRDYGFKAHQDISSTNSAVGLGGEDGLETLLDKVKGLPKLGLMIEKVEADFESKEKAALLDGMTPEEWFCFANNLPESKDK
jgi:superfamily II DNA or RNA helicase